MSKRIAGDSKRAIAYLRVSTEKQGLSLDAQRHSIELWAQANGVSVAEYCVDEGISGATSIEARPALLAAIAGLKAHSAGLLLVARRDRLSRDVANACVIERMTQAQGSVIYSVDGAGNGDSPTDEFTRHILNAMGQLERRLIGARTKAAMAAKKARGEYIGGNKALAETLPKETVQLIQDLYRSGNFSHESLAVELNLRGVPTASGKGEWRKNTVQKALKVELAQ